ncbi:hypothetical protein CISIN_1g034534mg [Citrus sinensis]|uniref:Uncharacterized protein n=1 Tax=Citrus sinensis TaxID=2711 RepID=A0A067DPD5_CITSI|nr:hypothetical protein CISIN_1g034534mg [Citrus sinensis]
MALSQNTINLIVTSKSPLELPFPAVMSPPSRHRFLLFGYPTPFGATSRRWCQFLYLLQQCGFRYSLLEHSLICKRFGVQYVGFFAHTTLNGW